MLSGETPNTSFIVSCLRERERERERERIIKTDA
jgi:hypothetical protein